MRTSAASLILLLLALLAPPGALAQSPAPLPAPLPAMPTQNAAARAARGAHDCLIEPSMVVNVGSPVDGVLEMVGADRGDIVRKGQVMARLMSGVETAAVELSRSRVEFDKRKVERNETLFQKQLISEQERDEMVTEARLHEGELKREQENLKLRTIVSPINGIVVERRLAPGELIRADKSVVLKLAQIDPLNVEVIAPAELFGSLQVGMQGTVSLLPIVPGAHQARVAVVDKLIDPASGTFWVRLQLPNPENRIPAGIRCKVQFSR